MPSFETVKHALAYLEAMGTASEVHGLLCALFVTGAVVRKQAWVNSVLSQRVEKGDLSAKDAQQTLEALYVATEAAFKTDDFQLQLLVPSDDTQMEQRIDALAEWCQGFIAGLNLVGVNITAHPNAEVHEALQDIVKIATMEYQNEQTGDEAAESDLMELIEYIRMAVLLIAAEQKRDETKDSGSQQSQHQH